jgi:preprotein translocase subunit SecD
MITKLLNSQVGRYILVFAAGVAITFLILPSYSSSKEEHLKREKEITESYEKKISEKESEFQQLKSKQQEETAKLKQEKLALESEYRKRVDSLTSENNSLKKSTEKVTVITTYPDGRVEKKIVSREVIEKESQKVAQVKIEAEQKLKETKELLQKEFDVRLTEINSVHEAEKQKLTLELSKIEEKLKEEQQKNTTVSVNSRKFSLGIGKKTNHTNFVTAEYDFYGPLYAGSILDFKGTSYDAMGLSVGVRF